MDKRRDPINEEELREELMQDHYEKMLSEYAM